MDTEIKVLSLFVIDSSKLNEREIELLRELCRDLGLCNQMHIIDPTKNWKDVTIKCTKETIPSND